MYVIRFSNNKFIDPDFKIMKDACSFAPMSLAKSVKIFIQCLMIGVLSMGWQKAHSQKRVKLVHADELQGAKRADGENFQKLIGHVVLTQNQTTIYCDSAYLYRGINSVEAFGKVRITDGDSVVVTSRRLEYNGDTKTAKLRDNVIFEKLGMAKLYTEYLDFDRPTNMAYYFNRGKLVDSINVLTSQKGYYDINSNMASFKRDVKVINPDYTMTSDSLQYNSKTKIIYFPTRTNVLNKDSSTFVYEGGEYDTRRKKSVFEQGVAETISYMLEGLAYKLDNARQFYEFRGDVKMTSKEENLTIHGQAVDYDKAHEISKVFNQPWLEKVTDEGDTLFIRADTMVSIDNVDPAKKRLLAYNNVRIYKKDMQGLADSMVYQSLDSTLYFFKDPVLWTQGNQMTADSIRILMKNNNINKIFMRKNAFVIAQDTLIHFNQIKGRNMTADFVNSQIERVYVEGNGESLYFVLDDEKSFAGMNKIICSNILIRFKEGKVDNFSFYTQPDGNFIPPQELKPDLQKLKDFNWKGNARPTKEDVVPQPVDAPTSSGFEEKKKS